MNRRAFVTGLGAVLAAPLVGEAQPPAAVPKIGYLSPWASSSDAIGLDAFRDALREHGYTDGTNVVIIPRFANEDYHRLPSLAAELVKLNVNVIVAVTTRLLWKPNGLRPPSPLSLRMSPTRFVPASSRAWRDRVATSRDTATSRLTSCKSASPC